jgi:hypothetical protein
VILNAVADVDQNRTVKRPRINPYELFMVLPLYYPGKKHINLIWLKDHFPGSKPAEDGIGLY